MIMFSALMMHAVSVFGLDRNGGIGYDWRCGQSFRMGIRGARIGGARRVTA